ncbi:MAG TPA: MFS transporter [Bryobacteraceae bacterium]|jgi:predicted MFS family arabinose efflux permease|nr:MFS transporter [Bryobacteraceae bacterium]
MPPHDNETSLRYPGWPVAFAAAGCVFVSFASLLVYTFSVFLKPLTQEFGWSRESTSLAFGIAAMTVAVCSPPLGILLDRFPARRIILPCMTVFGCAFASLALMTRHLWQLYAVFFVLGAVGNGTAHLAYTRALTTWFRERRGAAFAILMSGGAVGAMVLPPIAQALIDSTGWRNAVAILGVFVLVVGLPLGLRVKERAVSARTNQSMAVGATVTEGVRSRIFWIVVAVLFCNSLGQNGAITHLSAMLTDRGVSPGGAALAASALGGATLLGRLLTGWMLDRFFAPRVAMTMLLVSAAGAFVLSRASTVSMGVIAASLIGVGMGAEADVTPWLLAKYFGLRSFSTLYAWTWTAYAIAGAIGPVIMGKAFDATGSYAALLTQLAGLTACAAVLMLFMPRYENAPVYSEPARAAAA